LSIIDSIKINTYVNASDYFYDDLIRATECAFYYADFNDTLTLTLLSVAAYSSIQSDSDAIAYMNYSDKVGVKAFSNFNSNITDWKNSCNNLVNKQVNATSTTTTTATTTSMINSNEALLNTKIKFENDTKKYHSFQTSSDSWWDAHAYGRVDAIYINGICSGPIDNAASVALLIHRFKKYPILNNVNLTHFNNPPNGLLCSMDLLEVLQQKIQEKGGAQKNQYSLKDVVRFMISWSITGGTFLSSLYSYLFIHEVMDKFSFNVAKLISSFTVVDDTVQELVSRIKISITKQHPVIMIAHSQGNLYMNAAFSSINSYYAYFTTHDFGKGMYIATPTSYTYMLPYVTRTDDKVINALRLVSKVLPGNIIPNNTNIYGLNHFFTDYLKDSKVLPRIMSNITQLVENIGYYYTAFTVRIQYSSDRSKDLYIYEPDGTHVFDQNMVGNVGKITIYDESYSPYMAYTTTFNKLKTGTYIIGSSSEDDTKLLLTYGGSSSEWYHVDLFEKCPFFELTVTINADASYRFSINAALPGQGCPKN
jgi:hypothetical protein